jgi:hypothetical protein
MDTREVKRLKNRFSKFGEPLGIVALALMFVLPTLAVLNLSPSTSGKEKPVLGVEDKTGVGAVLVGGVHDIVKEETLTFPTDLQFNYSATLIKRSADMYSKPVLQLVNYNSEGTEVTVSGSTQLPTGSEIALIVNDLRYVIQDVNGETSVHEILLPGSSENIMFLQLDTREDVGFNDRIDLTIVSK